MSRPHKTKKKRPKARKKENERKSESKTWTVFVSPKIGCYFFLVGLVLLFLKFVMSLAADPDFLSPMLSNSDWIFGLGISAATILTGTFGYFGCRYILGYKLLGPWGKAMLALSFIIVSGLYIASFTKEISPNGDNGEYLIAAKSLVEKGGVYRLESKSEPANTLAAIGLPILLAPIYQIWGFDIIKMKILIMFIAILNIVLLFFLFRKTLGIYVGAMMSIVVGTSPYLIGNAKSIMTETPYLMWSVLTLMLIIKYRESESFSWKLFVLSLLGVIMTYLTRSIGAGTLVAMMIFLGLYVNWALLFTRNGVKQLVASFPFRKLMYILGPLLIVGFIWQLWQAANGMAQAQILFDGGIKDRLVLNLSSAYRVVAQMLVEPLTYKFQNFHVTSNLVPNNALFISVLFLLGLGVIEGMKRRDLLTIYMSVIFLLVMAASLTNQEMVIIRYLSILVPFMTYATYVGAKGLMRWVDKFKFANASSLLRALPLLLLAQMMFVNITANNTNIILSEVGNGPAYLDFVDVAKWSAKNLPQDAYVMSIKPRVFYVLSNKKGERSTTTSEVYSEAYEAEKIKTIIESGVTHVIIDGMSGSSRKNIRPLVQNNPDLFQTMYLGSISGTASVVKVKRQKEQK